MTQAKDAIPSLLQFKASLKFFERIGTEEQEGKLSPAAASAQPGGRWSEVGSVGVGVVVEVGVGQKEGLDFP